jgi:hypothetical protein
MSGSLAPRLSTEGRTLDTVTAWMNDELKRTWKSTWDEHQQSINDMWERIGEPAYGLYNRELFHPIQRQLDDTGMTCSPKLPGTLPLSEEHWGGEDHRERRMWTLLFDEQRNSLGAAVTRFSTTTPVCDYPNRRPCWA